MKRKFDAPTFWLVCHSLEKRDTDTDKYLFIYLRIWRLHVTRVTRFKTFPSSFPTPRLRESPHSRIALYDTCHVRKLFALFSLCCGILTESAAAGAGMYPQEHQPDDVSPCFIVSTPFCLLYRCCVSESKWFMKMSMKEKQKSILKPGFCWRVPRAPS